MWYISRFHPHLNVGKGIQKWSHPWLWDDWCDLMMIMVKQKCHWAFPVVCDLSCSFFPSFLMLCMMLRLTDWVSWWVPITMNFQSRNAQCMSSWPGHLAYMRVLGGPPTLFSLTVKINWLMVWSIHTFSVNLYTYPHWPRQQKVAKHSYCLITFELLILMCFKTYAKWSSSAWY